MSPLRGGRRRSRRRSDPARVAAAGTSVAAVRWTVAWRGWGLLQIPRHIAAYLLLVDLVGFGWAGLTLGHLNGDHRQWASLALLAATALVFEEGSRRVARLKIRLGSALRADMTSVWAVAAAVALPRGMAAVLLAAVFAYDWFRHFRPAGEALFRKLFVGATAVIGTLTASVFVDWLQHAGARLPWLLTGLAAVVVGMTTYTLVNRVLVTVALVLFGGRGRDLLGSSDDNLVELATMCIGGLLSLAVLQQPWLVVLAIPPMFTLQRGAMMRELETAATTDSKTGLLNAVAWEHLAERELERAQRESYPLSVLIVDIDRFKRVNDVYGHLVGDQVLRRVGRAISAELREYDGVARFGGEEFVAALPDVDTAAALLIAERVRNRVNQLRVSDLVDGLEPDQPDVLSVSIGVSCTGSDPAEIPTLLREADAALYRAKETGRNRVVLAGESIPQLPEQEQAAS